MFCMKYISLATDGGDDYTVPYVDPHQHTKLNNAPLYRLTCSLLTHLCCAMSIYSQP